MATSSIHIETSKPSALIHNERVFSPDYLVVNDKSVNENKSYTKLHISELEKLAKEDYQKFSKNNRKLPSNATLIKEAMINLEKHHTLKDLEKVKDTLEKEYGYKITNMSIHRDEGYIYTDKKNYTMGRNQFKNFKDTPFIAELDTKDNKFYEWTLQNNKWIRLDEIRDYKINYNYHGHIVMLNYDFNKHGTIRNNLKELSKMQTLVANDLGMKRGMCSSTVEAKKIGVQVQQSRKRMNIKEYKIQKRKEKELEKELENEKQNTFKLAKELYNFRQKQKEITSLIELSVEDRKALHQLNTMCKNNKITPSELEKEINNLIISYNNQKTELSEKDELIKKLNNKINPIDLNLKERIKKIQKDELIIKANEKINYYDSEILKIENLEKKIDDLLLDIETKVSQIENLKNENEVLKKENENLKKENSFLKQVIDKVLIYANYKIKELINYGKPQFKKSVCFEDFAKEVEKENNHKNNSSGVEMLNKKLENLDYSKNTLQR